MRWFRKTSDVIYLGSRRVKPNTKYGTPLGEAVIEFRYHRGRKKRYYHIAKADFNEPLYRECIDDQYPDIRHWIADDSSDMYLTVPCDTPAQCVIERWEEYKNDVR
jgi:hypothetical protein